MKRIFVLSTSRTALTDCQIRQVTLDLTIQYSKIRELLILILTGAFLLTACGAGKGIEIHGAWMRPAGQGENGAIYFVIHNHSSQADALISVTSDIAAAAEMHESKMSGDIMQMNQVESVLLEPYAEIEFAPGGLHIMLVDLTNDLKIGDQIEVILRFKNSEDMNVAVPVRETATPEQDHPSEDH
jgi:copper(I)-binding protein